MVDEICKWYEDCPMRKFYEEGRLHKKYIEDYCFNRGRSCQRFEMKEKRIDCPDNMLPDGEIDESLG